MAKYIVIILIVIVGYFLWPNSRMAKQESTELSTGLSNLYNSMDNANQSSIQESVINLYATSWCGYCAKTRKLFKQKGVRYIEHDIEKSQSARDRYNELGGRGVPLIEADGVVIKGYNEPLLRKLTEDERYKL